MEEQPGGQVEGDSLGEAGGELEPRLWDRLGMGTTGGGPGPVVQRLRGEAQGGRLEAQEDGTGGRPCGCETHSPHISSTLGQTEIPQAARRGRWV